MKPKVQENEIDTITQFLITKGVAPDQARKYALFALGKGDITDITNESIGTINDLINPNAVTLPNIEDEKAITDYIIGATSENYVKQLENEAYQEAAPNYIKIKSNLYGKPENPWLTKIINSIDSGKSWPEIQTDIIKTRLLAKTPQGKIDLNKSGFNTPFDNMLGTDALRYAKAIYDEKVAGDKNLINKKQKFLQSDPFFSKGILPETFQYGLKTDYKNRTIKAPLADKIKPDADLDSVAAVESIFGYNPSGLTSDVATRKLGQKGDKKVIPGFNKPLNAMELKRIAFDSAAKEYLNKYYGSKGLTPALDLAQQRLLIGTVGK